MPAIVNLFVRLIPAFLVRVFARPYVAGDSLTKAIEVAAELQRSGVLTTLDLLAETIEERETAERNLATYLEMIDRIAADPRFADPQTRPTVSLKLSSYTTAPLDKAGGDAPGAAEAVRRIAAAAATKGVRLTIDMESRHWTGFTLRLLDELAGVGHRVGAVLQTRLNRTEADLDRLPQGCRVRLVIGIYEEPSELAVTDKERMKERMLRFAEVLLQRGHYVEFATHDERWVRRFVDSALPRYGTDRFELQMLYGVPRGKLIEEMRARGCRIRLYVPFALSWPMAIAYLRRRLDEFPAMVWLVMKNWIIRR